MLLNDDTVRKPSWATRFLCGVAFFAVALGIALGARRVFPSLHRFDLQMIGELGATLIVVAIGLGFWARTRKGD